MILVLADLPIPTEAIIAILILASQAIAAYKKKRDERRAQETYDELIREDAGEVDNILPAVYEPTAQEREIILRRQQQAYEQERREEAPAPPVREEPVPAHSVQTHSTTAPIEGMPVHPLHEFTQQPVEWGETKVVTATKKKTSPAAVSSHDLAEAKSSYRSNLSRGTHRRTQHRTRLNRFLSTPSATRDAIVIAEVLGPPLALRGHESS